MRDRLASELERGHRLRRLKTTRRGSLQLGREVMPGLNVPGRRRVVQIDVERVRVSLRPCNRIELVDPCPDRTDRRDQQAAVEGSVPAADAEAQAHVARLSKGFEGDIGRTTVEAGRERCRLD